MTHQGGDHLKGLCAARKAASCTQTQLADKLGISLLLVHHLRKQGDSDPLIPEDTVKDFIFINDTLGMNINIYTDNLYFKNKMFLFGINASLTFPDKNFSHLGTPTDLFDDYSIAAAPYLELKLFNGELHSMVQVNFTDIMDSDWYKAFKISIGYKSQF